jgi:hypothetical protein
MCCPWGYFFVFTHILVDCVSLATGLSFLYACISSCYFVSITFVKLGSLCFGSFLLELLRWSIQPYEFDVFTLF